MPPNLYDAVLDFFIKTGEKSKEALFRFAFFYPLYAVRYPLSALRCPLNAIFRQSNPQIAKKKNEKI